MKTLFSITVNNIKIDLTQVCPVCTDGQVQSKDFDGNEDCGHCSGTGIGLTENGNLIIEFIKEAIDEDDLVIL